MRFLTLIPFILWPIATLLLFVWAVFGLNGFALAVVVLAAIVFHG